MQNWVRPSAQKTLLNSDNHMLKKEQRSMKQVHHMVWCLLASISKRDTIHEQAAPQVCWRGWEKRELHAIPGLKEDQINVFKRLKKSIINTPFLMSALYLRSPTRKASIKMLHSEYPSPRESLAQALCGEKGFLDLHWAKLETQALRMLKAYSDQVADAVHPALPIASLAL